MDNYSSSPSLARRATCRHGDFVFYANDLVIGRSMALYGEWAEPEVSLLAQIIRTGDVLVEAGSNIGVHTLPLARLAGAEGTVHAFEPLVCNSQLLNANIVNNGLQNIRSYQMGVGERPGICDFPQPWPDQPNNYGALGLYTSQIIEDLPMVPCGIVSVDSLQLKRIDFIKIDVEGHEREVILGSMSSISIHRPALLVETHNYFSLSRDKNGHVDWIINQLDPYNYIFLNIVTPLYNNNNWNKLLYNEFQGQWSFDMLCLPGDRFTVLGLDDSKKFPMHETNADRWRSAKIFRVNSMIKPL